MTDATPNPTSDPAASPPPAAQPGSPAPNGSGDPGIAATDRAPGADWPTIRGSIKDDKLRAHAERFNSLEEIISGNVKQREELSTRVRLPGEKSTPEELAQYRKVAGIPDTAAAYDVKPPEGSTFSADDTALIESLKPIAHEAHMTQAAFAKFILAGAALGAKAREAGEKQLADYRKTQDEALTKEWGVDKDKNLAFANRATTTHGGPEFKTFLETAVVEGQGRLGDHPSMVKFLATIGRKSDEADPALIAGASERENAKQELQRINQETPPGTDKYMQAHVQKRVRELYEIIYGNEPVVGGGGRTA